MTAIEQTLHQLTAVAWRDRADWMVYQLARDLTGHEASPKQKVEAIVAEVHRKYGRFDSSAVESLDADDACLFVATLAMSVGIRCRFVAARYDQAWTCWVAYEVGDHWETVDPLRQRPERDPDELVMGPMPGEEG